jgi:pimeloyl-ACP methyl ester carboxylesterase
MARWVGAEFLSPQPLFHVPPHTNSDRARCGLPVAGDALADDLASVIDALDLRGVTLIGHSFSSGEVVRYLSRYGSSRVDGVVFVAPAAIPFLLKTDDNPCGVHGAVFEQMRGALVGWPRQARVA